MYINNTSVDTDAVVIDGNASLVDVDDYDGNV